MHCSGELVELKGAVGGTIGFSLLTSVARFQLFEEAAGLSRCVVGRITAPCLGRRLREEYDARRFAASSILIRRLDSGDAEGHEPEDESGTECQSDEGS